MAHTMVRVIKSGKAPDTLLERLKVFGLEVPGHYRPEDLPSTGLAAAGRGAATSSPRSTSS